MTTENDSSTQEASSLHSLVRRLVDLAKREHYNCEEDTWYGCPLSRDGCSNDSWPKDKCNCYADAHNAEVAQVSAAMEALLAKAPNADFRDPAQ